MFTLKCIDTDMFDYMHKELLDEAMAQPPLDSLTWQSQYERMKTLEIQHAVLSMPIPMTTVGAQTMVLPNLPWAEDHFQERISGVPYNPPPSSSYWPYAQKDNAAHKEGEIFSHTYPERMWPRQAAMPDAPFAGEPDDNYGLRYRLGDLNDMVNLLRRDPYTRQAFLPIWFPEDTGAVDGQRVPCTLGYHFMIRPNADGDRVLTVSYYMRSCDLMRHFRDDVYMAMRLAQLVASQVQVKTGIDVPCRIGNLNMYIASLHIFEKDVPIIRYQRKMAKRNQPDRGLLQFISPTFTEYSNDQRSDFHD